MDLSGIELDRASKYPVYRQLADALRDRIRSGAAEPDEPLADEAELSRQFGLNRLTLRKSLRILQDEGLIYKVWGQGVFVGRRVEETPAPKTEWRVHLAAIAMPEVIEHSHYILIARGATDALHAKHIEVVAIRYLSSQDARLHLEHNAGALCGAIFYPLNDGESFRRVIGQLRLAGVPVVLVGNTLHDPDVDTVESGDDTGAAEAVRHLAGHGHRRIAFVRVQGKAPHHGMREAGYLRGMAEAGLRRHLAAPGLSDDKTGHVAHGYEVARSLFTGRRPPTALLAQNDMLAIGIHQALTELNIRMPEDVELIGFGDDLESHIFYPDRICPFSTVGVDRVEVGRQAAERLLARLADPTLPARKIVVPTRLIHRGTTRVAGDQ